MTCGIYRIRLKESMLQYIGSSKQIEARWEYHRYYLGIDSHDNRYLQRLWNKHGSESFLFEIVEYCYETDLLRLEQNWIDNTPRDQLINLALIAGRPPRRIGHETSPETRRKISEAKQGRVVSDETRLKLSKNHRGGPKYGHTVSDESRRKMSDSAKRRIKKTLGN